MNRMEQVGAGGLDANVPTGTVIGLFEEPDDEGCIVDYGIDDANLQVCPHLTLTLRNTHCHTHLSSY